MINLPRQARDKHRKNSKKRVAFSGPGKRPDDCCSGCEGHTGCKAAVHFEYGPSGGVETFPFGAIVYLLKNPNICQDRLGTNIEETLNKMFRSECMPMQAVAATATTRLMTLRYRIRPARPPWFPGSRSLRHHRRPRPSLQPVRHAWRFPN